MKKRLLSLCITLAAVAAGAMAQVQVTINNTNFPDENFRNFLLAQSYGKDGILTEDELMSVSTLDVSGLNISNLTGIEHFTALMFLDCSNNNLTTLNVSWNTMLAGLTCYGNNLAAWAVQALITSLPRQEYGGELIILRKGSTQDNAFGYAQLMAAEQKGWKAMKKVGDGYVYLGISINEKNFPDENFRNYLLAQDYGKDAYLTEEELMDVEWLMVGGLGIGDLTGIEYFTALEGLSCEYNDLESLEVSGNPSLRYLFIHGNRIEGLNMGLLVSSLPELENGGELIIQCGDNYQDNNVSIEQVLTAEEKGWKMIRMGYNGYVYLGVSINEKNFPDENFRYFLQDQDYGSDSYLSEEELQVIKSLWVCDLSIGDLIGIEYFTALEELYCDNNNLEFLDVSRNPALNALYCRYNSLTSLELNTQLFILYCDYNALESLDVSLNTQLLELGCSFNGLTSLDVSQNMQLIFLFCENNNLEFLDVSWNTQLVFLSCYGNHIEDLDMEQLVSSLPDREYEYDGELIILCEGSYQDNSVDIAQVKQAVQKGWKMKKSTPNGYVYLGISINEKYFPDKNFRNYLLDQDYGVDGYLTEEELMDVMDMDVMGQNIQDLTGIGYFTALTSLYCGGNNLTSLDVSQNTALEWLDCSCTSLSSLNVSWNKALKTLLCYSNSLTSLDVSQNTALEMLDCESNNLTSLDVSNNTALMYLSCWENNLTSLNVSQNTALQHLHCFSNNLTSLDVSQSTALNTLYCYSNSLTELDVSNNTALEKLRCEVNSLTSLNVSKNTALTFLACDVNSLTSLNVSKNTALTGLSCYGNRISEAGMTSLVNSLRSLPSGTEGTLTVRDDNKTSVNVITASQVKIATDKGWTVKKINSFYEGVVYAGQGDVNGDGKIDQNDLDLIVKIIMGQKPENVGELAGDLNNDGRTDAADVVIMVSILNGNK